MCLVTTDWMVVSGFGHKSLLMILRIGKGAPFFPEKSVKMCDYWRGGEGKYDDWHKTEVWRALIRSTSEDQYQSNIK